MDHTANGQGPALAAAINPMAAVPSIVGTVRASGQGPL